MKTQLTLKDSLLTALSYVISIESAVELEREVYIDEIKTLRSVLENAILSTKNTTNAQEISNKKLPKKGDLFQSPQTGEIYLVTAVGKRYALVEIKSEYSTHEFPRRLERFQEYKILPKKDRQT